MRMEQNKKGIWYLDISKLDLCFCCLWKIGCPLLEEVRKNRLLINNGVMYKEECDIYRYYVDEEVEKYLYKDFKIGEE